MTERKQISLQKDDTQAAFDALRRAFECTKSGVDNWLQSIGAAVADHRQVFLSALTAQLTKTDDNVSCPRVANTGDINAELLNALRAVDAAAKSSGSIIGFAAKVFKLLSKIRKAIARAERKVVV